MIELASQFITLLLYVDNVILFFFYKGLKYVKCIGGIAVLNSLIPPYLSPRIA